MVFVWIMQLHYRSPCFRVPRMATKQELKWLVTANFTADAVVAYMRKDTSFAMRPEEAALFATKEEAEAARKIAQRMERLVSDPYLMEVAPTPEGLDLLSARERIRAKGPTTRVRRPDPSANSR
jgi:hypothetical protein